MPSKLCPIIQEVAWSWSNK